MSIVNEYKAIINKHNEKILYLIFGILTTIIYLGSYKIFLNFGIDYKVSTNISFVLAVIFAFFTNKHIVFKKHNDMLREMILFIGTRIFTQIINDAGLIFAVEVVHQGEFISQVFLSIIVVVLNYVFSKYAIFIHKDKY